MQWQWLDDLDAALELLKTTTRHTPRKKYCKCTKYVNAKNMSYICCHRHNFERSKSNASQRLRGWLAGWLRISQIVRQKFNVFVYNFQVYTLNQCDVKSACKIRLMMEWKWRASIVYNKSITMNIYINRRNCQNTK